MLTNSSLVGNISLAMGSIGCFVVLMELAKWQRPLRTEPAT